MLCRSISFSGWSSGPVLFFCDFVTGLCRVFLPLARRYDNTKPEWVQKHSHIACSLMMNRVRCLRIHNSDLAIMTIDAVKFLFVDSAPAAACMPPACKRQRRRHTCVHFRETERSQYDIVSDKGLRCAIE